MVWHPSCFQLASPRSKHEANEVKRLPLHLHHTLSKGFHPSYLNILDYLLDSNIAVEERLVLDIEGRLKSIYLVL